MDLTFRAYRIRRALKKHAEILNKLPYKKQPSYLLDTIVADMGRRFGLKPYEVLVMFFSAGWYKDSDQ